MGGRCRGRRSSSGRSRCPRRSRRDRRRRSGSASARHRTAVTQTWRPLAARYTLERSRRSDEEEAARDDRRRAARAPFDHTDRRRPPDEPPAPACRRRPRRTPTLPCQTAGSLNRAAPPPGVGNGLQLAAGRRVHSRQPCRAGAAAAGRPSRPGPRSRRSRSAGLVEPRSRSESFRCCLVGGRPVAEELRTRRARARARCRPSRCLPFQRRVPGRDDEIAGGGIDGRAVSRPDRRVAGRAGAGCDQRVPVRAERVPDVVDRPRLLRTASRRAPGRAERRRCSRRS